MGRKKATRVMALVGAQTGSEGKGVVAHRLASEFDVAIRTGAPNAGHSIVHDGILYKMQSIPCGWVNPNCMLVLGAGALVNLDILARELRFIEKVYPNIRERLFVDLKAGILEQRHHDEEGGVDGELHKRMGSTGEGVGAARRDRMLRNPKKFRLAADAPELAVLGVQTTDTVTAINNAIQDGMPTLLEGTQGSGLSLIHGAWPHVTTSDTNAAQMAADAGIPPQWVTETVLVARTYPIRVAGASGPLHNEVSWEEMSKRVGREVSERTTVTNKLRRIGEWDEFTFRRAVQLNDPKWVALTFMDYLSPEDKGKTRYEDLQPTAHKFVNYIERVFDVPVDMIGTDWSNTEGWTCVDRRVLP